MGFSKAQGSASLIVLLLLAASLGHVEAHSSPLKIWHTYDILESSSVINAAMTQHNPCHEIDWGEALRKETQFLVDVRVVEMGGGCIQILRTFEHSYFLGKLAPGPYMFDATVCSFAPVDPPFSPEKCETFTIAFTVLNRVAGFFLSSPVQFVIFMLSLSLFLAVSLIMFLRELRKSGNVRLRPWLRSLSDDALPLYEPGKSSVRQRKEEGIPSTKQNPKP